MIRRMRPLLDATQTGTVMYYRRQVIHNVRQGKSDVVAAEKAWNNFIKAKKSGSIRRKLSDISDGVCIYCEMSIAATVDHFKPKTKFPYRAFYWSNLNWVCGACNQHKNANYSQKLLNPMGLVEPGDYFVIDRVTGEMLPNPARPPMQRKHAASTRKILGLNQGVLPQHRLKHVNDFLTDVRAFVHHPTSALDDVIMRRFVGFGLKHLTAIRCCILSVPLQPLVRRWLALSPNSYAQLRQIGWI